MLHIDMSPDCRLDSNSGLIRTRRREYVLYVHTLWSGAKVDLVDLKVQRNNDLIIEYSTYM
jgi:hypothetical protein